MGLIGAGSASQVFTARMPQLYARLGPVKGFSFSAARKLVKSLRAGFAVPNYQALEGCRAIWICVPDARIDVVVRDLAAQTAIHKTVVVVCESERDSASFDLLRSRGARVATLNCLGEGRKLSLVAEGHREALRLLRGMVEDKRALIELHAGAKAGYLAGVHLITVLLRPWVASALACLQKAGVPRPMAVDLIEPLAIRTLHTQLRSGSKALGSVVEAELQHALEQTVSQLRPLVSREADLYAEGLRLALQYLHRDSKRAVSQHA